MLELKNCTVRNSIPGMQCKAQTGAIHQYCEDLERRYAPGNRIYDGAIKRDR